MKIKLSVLTFLLSLFLVGSAFAVPYSVNFDADGTGATYAAQEIWGFDTEGIAQYNVGGITTTTFIKQDLGADGILNNGDTFIETFTTMVTNGTDAIGNAITPGYTGFPPTIPASNLKIDVSLSGYIFGYNNGGDGDTTRLDYGKIINDSYFTQMAGGGATMYLDANGDNMLTAGETIAATFGFATAAPAFLAPTVWPGAGGTSTYSVSMSLDTYNTDFWSDASFPVSLADLVSDGFLLTYNEGSAKALGIEGAPTSPANEILLGFSDNGIDMTFDAVPEPATLLLLGVGLLGLAGVSRKKIS